MRLSLRLIGGLLAAVILGAGCGKSQPNQQIPVTGPKPAELQNATPHEASQKVNFVVGSNIELTEPSTVAGASVRVRTIVIDRFAPMQAANLTWKLSVKTETAASKKARDAARRASKPSPDSVYDEKVVNGNVDGFNLNATSHLYLPGYWPDETRGPSFGSNGIWLPADAFEGLVRNRVATVDYGVLDATLIRNIQKNAAVRDALSRLQKQMSAIENRKDVKLMTGEQQFVDWPINVNGKDVKLEAIKAKTWFGEVIVLNNKQNPLVLKFTLDSELGKLPGMSSAYQILRQVTDYEIKKIGDAQE